MDFALNLVRIIMQKYHNFKNLIDRQRIFMSLEIRCALPNFSKNLSCLPITKKTLDKCFQYEKIAKRKGCIYLGVRLQASEGARLFLDNIYSQLYFSLPRLPAKSSSQRINERLFSILLLLEQNFKQGKNLTIGEIGQICKLSPSDTTRKIKDLERRGLVKKSNVKSDDRLKEITLTPQGIDFLSSEKDARRFWFERIFKILEEKDRIFLVDIFLKIMEKAEAFKVNE